MRPLVRHLILLLPIMLAACATTGSDGSGISVETASKGQAVPGAHCVVSTHSGNWTVTTPATVDVGAVNGDLRVVCDKAGYRTSEFVYRPYSGRSYGGPNVGLGVGGGSGNVGVGVGLSVPIGGFGGGGGGYPSRVTVDLNPL